MIKKRDERARREGRDWQECLLGLSGSFRLSGLSGSEASKKRDKPDRPGTRLAFLASLAFLAVALAGCGSPQVHYYTLSSTAVPAAGEAQPATAIPSVGLGPITLPDVVDRPQFVLRAGANRVVIAEEHRWAEPLKSEIPRVIAENLSHLLGVKQVWSYPQSAAETAEIRVLVDIQRFDSVPGDAVTVDASWTVQRKSGEPAPGRSLAREAAGGPGHDALAAAHSRALATVSRDIAAAIRALDSAGSKSSTQTLPAPPDSPAPPAPPASAPSS
jgi:uncharacterized lipoprotein YmbA